ncbi:MAG: PBP1A family penicillin-binding protein [Rhizobacter sp.]|nr:PBP1A family penicillin-binding protein [Chlorobiales bacterium]
MNAIAPPPSPTPPDESVNHSSPLREKYFNDPDYRRKVARRRKQLELIYRILIGIIAAGIATVVGLFIYLAQGLPSLEQLENPKPELASEVRSADGVLIKKYFMQNRRLVPLDSISPNVANALIATEDIKFYDHWGFDSRRFVTAMITNVVTLRRRWQGASTITQQLAKNLWLTPERHWRRKLQELMVSVQIERTYTKDEILALYLNTVYFGAGAHGIESAAATYFGKTAMQLTVDESALLVALLKNPTKYNPVDRPDDALSRRNLIIGMTARAGFISESEAETYKEKKIKLTYTPVTDIGISPYFTEYVRQRLSKMPELQKFDIYRDGLAIYTTIDSRMQLYADSALTRQLALLQAQVDKTWSWKYNEKLKNDFIREDPRFADLRQKGATEKEALAKLNADKEWLTPFLKAKTTVQAAFVAIDPATGKIKAWVGGKNFNQYKFDHVWQALRQPGSSFKPFVYTTAIDMGVPTNYEVLNQEVSVQTGGKNWQPQNSDGKMGGFVTLRRALQASLNNITVRLVLSDVPPTRFAQMAKRLGIHSKIEENAASALGASEVTPLEITSAFGTFANQGQHVEPIGILRIESKDGNVIWEAQSPDRTQALDRATNYVMVTMLQGVVDGGTASGARAIYRGPAGGKTGTSQDQKDAWFIGFTPQLVAGVWTGFDDTRVHFTSMEYGQGAKAALPVWANFMKASYDNKSLGLKSNAFFQRPDGVISIPISKETNLPADDATNPKNVYIEHFTKKGFARAGFTMPAVDSTGGKRATQPLAVPQPKRGEGQF